MARDDPTNFWPKNDGEKWSRIPPPPVERNMAKVSLNENEKKDQNYLRMKAYNPGDHYKQICIKIPLLCPKLE